MCDETSRSEGEDTHSDTFPAQASEMNSGLDTGKERRREGASDVRSDRQVESRPPKIRVASGRSIFGFRDGVYRLRQVNIRGCPEITYGDP